MFLMKMLPVVEWIVNSVVRIHEALDLIKPLVPLIKHLL